MENKTFFESEKSAKEFFVKDSIKESNVLLQNVNDVFEHLRDAIAAFKSKYMTVERNIDDKFVSFGFSVKVTDRDLYLMNRDRLVISGTSKDYAFITITSNNLAKAIYKEGIGDIEIRLKDNTVITFE